MGAEEFSALVFVPMSTRLGQPRPVRGMTAVGQGPALLSMEANGGYGANSRSSAPTRQATGSNAQSELTPIEHNQRVDRPASCRKPLLIRGFR
jgi:hypothetical protein